MSKSLTISIADVVYDKIAAAMLRQKKENKSEFVEELIRTGLAAEELAEE